MGSYDIFHPSGEEVPPMPMDLANSLTGPGRPPVQACTERRATMAIIERLSQGGTLHPLRTRAYHMRESLSKALD